ncbi:MAG: putative signal transducing protein [Acidobacteriota bacterium]
MEPARPIKDEETVLLTVVYNDVEANLIKTILDEAGIDCLLVSQVPHSVYPFTINGLGETKIRVLASELENARAILAESRERRPHDETEP